MLHYSVYIAKKIVLLMLPFEFSFIVLLSAAKEKNFRF